MAKGTTRLTVVIPAHNEERYLPRGLSSVAASLRQASVDARIIVVADRCSDATPSLAESKGARVIRKDASRCKHAYAQTLELGLQQALNGADYVAAVNADVVVSVALFQKAVETLRRDASIADVSPHVITETSTTSNTRYRVYERLFAETGLTLGIRGACRIYCASALQPIGVGECGSKRWVRRHA